MERSDHFKPGQWTEEDTQRSALGPRKKQIEYWRDYLYPGYSEDPNKHDALGTEEWKKLAQKSIMECLEVNPRLIKEIPHQFQHLFQNPEEKSTFYRPELKLPDLRERFREILEKIDSGPKLLPEDQGELHALQEEVPEWGFQNRAIWGFRKVKV